MNEHFGGADQQVFDLRNRRYPICYTVNPDSIGDLAGTTQTLRASLAAAIRLAGRSEYEAVEEIIASLDTACLELLKMHALHDVFWRSKDETMGARLINVGLDSADTPSSCPPADSGKLERTAPGVRLSVDLSGCTDSCSLRFETGLVVQLPKLPDRALPVRKRGSAHGVGGCDN